MPCGLYILTSLFQAPFFPKEAEKKGATPSDYGLVFGLNELVIFIASPIMGKNMQKLGAKRVFNSGIIIVGSCYIVFGLLVSYKRLSFKIRDFNYGNFCV